MSRSVNICLAINLTIAFVLCAEAGRAAVGLGAAAPTADRPQARVVVNGDRHDFGELRVGVTGRHHFALTNTGNRPLVLTRDRSTCGCCTCVCRVRLPTESTVAPGKSARVTIEWRSMLYTGRFRQSATILTNDPDRPEVKLLVTGRFLATVRAVPRELVFSRVPIGQPVTGEVRLVSYLDEPLKILACELFDPRGGEHFDVTWTPLAADQLRAEAGELTGYLVRVTVRPGLPPGAFRQRIVIRTNTSSVPTVELPVVGAVGSDISIVGRGWNAETGILTLGTVNNRTTSRWPLAIVIRGPHARDVKYRSVRASPDVLRVRLGKTTLFGDDAASRTSLILEIPSGSRSGNHLGDDHGTLGEIRIETTHPETPSLRIQVQFAVEG